MPPLSSRSAENPLVLTGGRVLIDDGVVETSVVVRDGQIAALVDDPPAGRVLDVGGRLIGPGLVDIHIHGAAGHSFEQAEDDDGVAAIVGHLASRGVTTVLAALASDQVETMVSTVHALHRYRDDPLPGTAEVAGVHLEGPFLTPAQAGAHSPAVLRDPDADAVARLASLRPAMITLAPELPGGVSAVEQFRAAGTVVAAGHSEARVPDLQAAQAAGLTHLTHLWSGQSALVREGPWRVPGLLEASLASTGLTAEVIADGKHLPPALLEIARRCLGEDLIVVSDATSGAGLPEGSRYALADVVCEVRDGVGVVVGADAFGGSTTTLEAMLAYLHADLGWPVAELFAMGSTRPAQIVGLGDRKGRIMPGYDADLLVVEDDLSPWATVVRGRLVRP
ncbi:N-acetylglucosamine-6-phosphate deacetylase [Ruania albidiflava]|uniref:N-acetylglucosamine-6-phosphate deacetylase n=1 Tax=Ruania albidiflava TaxID=366586 RepID=UPI0003B77FED|nr:amidohydrolase family protein [Ruania albidiflava]